MNAEKLPSHIEEYKNSENNKNSGIALFEVEIDKNLDYKTDLTINELLNINSLFVTNNFLITKGLKGSYSLFIEKVLRLKVSQDRKSRNEYVDVNRQIIPFDKQLQSTANFKTILDTKT